MSQDQKSIQQLKRDRRNHEQVHRSDAVSVIAKKGVPTLRWWPPPLRHVLRHGGLPDIDAKLEQFAVDPWRAPEWVGDAHFANEPTDLRWSARSPTPRSRLPAPIGTETRAMPTDYGLRIENLDCLQHTGGEPIQPCEDQPIDVAEHHALRRLAAQHIQLMP